MAQPATAIQKPAATAAKSLADVIKDKQASFAEVATKYMTPERLVKLALVAITKMPDLQKVPPLEVVAALIDCSRLGLEPNVEGGRWLLPFKRNSDNGTRYELVAVTDYRGLIDIARRSGEVLSIHADVRREHDLWEYWVGSEGPTLVHLRHRRAEGERGDILGAYAIVRLRNGEVQAEYLTMAQVNASRDRSRGADSKFSPWQRDYDAMAKKTAIRRLYNLLPKTPEIQAAREVLADEEDDARSGAAIDVTPTAGTRTGQVKARLAARLAPTPAPEASGEPEPTQPGEDVPGWGSAKDEEPGSCAP